MVISLADGILRAVSIGDGDRAVRDIAVLRGRRAGRRRGCWAMSGAVVSGDARKAGIEVEGERSKFCWKNLKERRRTGRSLVRCATAVKTDQLQQLPTSVTYLRGRASSVDCRRPTENEGVGRRGAGHCALSRCASTTC